MIRTTKGLLWAGAALAGSAAAYRLVARPFHRKWGATDADIRRRMPGDDLVAHPDVVTNHAVTIDVDPEEVWPWLVQMGEGKVGLYSYDWIENLLHMHVSSSDRVHPEHQHVSEGEALVRDNMIVVDQVYGEQALVLRVADHVPDLEVSCAFGLYPVGEHATRLVARTRYRNDAKKRVRHVLYDNFVLDLSHFAMERKMLLGIKERAENEHRRLVDERRRPPQSRAPQAR